MYLAELNGHSVEVRVVKSNECYGLVVYGVVNHLPKVEWGQNPFALLLAVEVDEVFRGVPPVFKFQHSIGSSVNIYRLPFAKINDSTR